VWHSGPILIHGRSQDGKWEVVDGLQRLSALVRFLLWQAAKATSQVKIPLAGLGAQGDIVQGA